MSRPKFEAWFIDKILKAIKKIKFDLKGVFGTQSFDRIEGCAVINAKKMLKIIGRLIHEVVV